jgi:excisionase family DNA binding protein
VTAVEQYLRATEAARILRVHPRTIARMIARGEIEATKIGGSYRIRLLDVKRMLP